MICIQPDQYWYCNQSNLGETPEWQGGARMGLLRSYDAILSMNWKLDTFDYENTRITVQTDFWCCRGGSGGGDGGGVVVDVFNLELVRALGTACSSSWSKLNTNCYAATCSILPQSGKARSRKQLRNSYWPTSHSRRYQYLERVLVY